MAKPYIPTANVLWKRTHGLAKRAQALYEAALEQFDGSEPFFEDLIDAVDSLDKAAKHAGEMCAANKKENKHV